MLPLLPFVAGLAAGAVVVKLWRNDKTTQTLENAKASIRKATVKGLSRIESSSAAMRDKLAVVEPVTSETPVVEPVASETPVVAAPATKTARPRKAVGTAKAKAKVSKTVSPTDGAAE